MENGDERNSAESNSEKMDSVFIGEGEYVFTEQINVIEKTLDGRKERVTPALFE